MGKRIYTRAFASVRFCSQSLDPLDVTLALRLPPDHTHRRGEPRIGRDGRTGRVREYAPYRAGQWSMSSERWVDSPRLHMHLLWLLNQLEPKAAAIAELRRREVEVDFFCFSSGYTKLAPSIPRAVRDRAAKLGITIEIDHYPMERTEKA
jgi:hypothetical protein